jgi:hypothetical protein
MKASVATLRSNPVPTLKIDRVNAAGRFATLDITSP